MKGGDVYALRRIQERPQRDVSGHRGLLADLAFGLELEVRGRDTAPRQKIQAPVHDTGRVIQGSVRVQSMVRTQVELGDTAPEGAGRHRTNEVEGSNPQLQGEEGMSNRCWILLRIRVVADHNLSEDRSDWHSLATHRSTYRCEDDEEEEDRRSLAAEGRWHGR